MQARKDDTLSIQERRGGKQIALRLDGFDMVRKIRLKHSLKPCQLNLVAHTTKVQTEEAAMRNDRPRCNVH